MLCDYNWKVLLLVVIATTNAEQTKALSLVYKPSANIPMFIPKYRRKSRVLFLDENEKNQPYGRGEIDLTGDKSRIKFDDSLDYEFTSTDDKNIDNPSGNERYYESSRYRYSYPKYLPYNNNRFGRPYAPNYGFEPYHVPYPPTLRNYGALGGWKARSPRVVFPYAPESANLVTNSHAGPLNDNVVFRDQNFGINDITTDDQNLQDIGSSTDAFAERDANDTRHDRLSRLHYGLKGKSLTKPMFVQITGTKVPYTKRNDIYLPMLKSILPEFKPISDDQINKINLFFKSTKNPKFRKGKAIDNGSPLQELQTHYADKLKTLQGINQPLSLSNLPLQDHNIPLSLSNLPLQDHNPPLSLSNLPLPEHNPPLLLINAPILSQDVKDTIQDLKTSLPETEDRQDDKKCSQGGTCEFFIYCWMVGGLLDGSCGSLLKGCCHRVAKSGVLGVQDSNSIEFANEAVNYGPVINDGSKSIDSWCCIIPIHI